MPSVREGYRAASLSELLVILKMLTAIPCHKIKCSCYRSMYHKYFCNIFAQLLFQTEIIFFTYFYPKFNKFYVLLYKQLARYWSEANPYFSITDDIQHNTECPHTWASNIVLKKVFQYLQFYGDCWGFLPMSYFVDLWIQSRCHSK